MKNKTISHILSIIFFLSFFSNLDGVGSTIQIIVISMIGITAFTVLISRRMQRVKIRISELILLLIGVISAVGVTSKTDNFYLVQYSLVFLVLLLSVMALSRVLEFNYILKSASNAYLLILLYIFTFYFTDFIFSIGGNVIEGVGLARFTPLNTHPDLMGFIFGGGFLILFTQYHQEQGRAKLLFLIGMILSISFILAASARGGLFSLLIVISIFYTSDFRNKITNKNLIFFILFLLFILPVFIIYFRDTIINFFNHALELDSTERGINSGGSGRLEIWQMGINRILESNITTLLFGDGFRTASYELIGFFTESSYINIIMENGIIMGLIFLGYVLFSSTKLFFKFRLSNNVFKIVPLIIIFALLQSIFNRYLLAIGNPFSILLLFMYVYLGDGKIFVLKSTNNSIYC